MTTDAVDNAEVMLSCISLAYKESASKYRSAALFPMSVTPCLTLCYRVSRLQVKPHRVRTATMEQYRTLGPYKSVVSKPIQKLIGLRECFVFSGWRRSTAISSTSK